MLVYLIGMPGAGKTTIGAKLAGLLGFAFTDLDAAIEEAEGLAIPEIFAAKGEAYFREAEARALQSIPEDGNRIVATGGGTPCFFDNMNRMRQRGLTVFLDVPAEILAQRLSGPEHAGRPLLQGASFDLKEKLTATLSARRQFYEQAHIVVPAANPEPVELAQLLRRHLPE